MVEGNQEQLISKEIFLKVNGLLICITQFAEKFKAQKKEMERHLFKAFEKVSNLDECVDLAIEFATNVQSRW